MWSLFVQIPYYFGAETTGDCHLLDQVLQTQSHHLSASLLETEL